MKYKLLILNNNSPDYNEFKQIYENNKREFDNNGTKMLSRNLKSNTNVVIVDRNNKVQYESRHFDLDKILDILHDLSVNDNKKLKRLSLYSNYNNNIETHSKFGYKDRQTALDTLRELNNYDYYYQWHIILSMYNRAKYHPHRTPEMEDAMYVYKQWLKDNNFKY